MPWQKSFDEDTALNNAMQVFWEKGFEPTSIADLLESTGLNRGSLYNAFGGKRQLFLSVLKKYDRDYREPMLAKLESLDDPKRAINTFLDSLVAETVADRSRKGCFLFNTALGIAAHDDVVQEVVSSGVKAIEAFFRRSIEVGQARGDIPRQLDPSATAKSLLASTVAIRVLGRGVFTEDSLQTIADEGKRLIE